MRLASVYLPCLLLLVAACGSPKSGPIAQPPGSPSASPSASPEPSPFPSPSPSPSRAVPPAPTRTSSGPATSSPSPRLRIGPGGSYMVTGTSAVALTFDDGPYPEHTPQILDLLRDNGVKATFCVLGRNAHTYPDLIRRIHNEGHTLCNHTWRHDLALKDKDEGAIRDDLAATTTAIRQAVPEAKVPYFRAPGGHFDTRLVDIARDMGMTSIYWHVDSRDWETSKYGRGESMVNQIVSNVQQSTRPGSIVISHDNLKPDTLSAYKYLLPWLKARFTLIALPPSGQLVRA